MAIQEVSAASTFEPVKFTLSEKIATHKHGMTDVLTLKMPTARSFITHGQPFTRTVKGKQPNLEVVFNYEIPALMGFLQDMAGLDPITVEMIPGNDLIPLFDVVIGIISFRPDRVRTPSTTSDELERS